MIKPVRMKHGVRWVPHQDRPRVFPGAPLLRKPELREPVLWFHKRGDEVWFVNDSKHVLQKVKPHAWGFFGVDGTAVELEISESLKELVYRNVQPAEAVLVDTYDPVYDLDNVIGLHLEIESNVFGNIIIDCGAKKGGIDQDVVCCWDTGEWDVGIQRLEK